MALCVERWMPLRRQNLWNMPNSVFIKIILKSGPIKMQQNPVFVYKAETTFNVPIEKAAVLDFRC